MLFFMITKIPQEKQYRIKTRLDISDRLYLTSELNMISSVDQDAYWLDF